MITKEELDLLLNLEAEPIFNGEGRKYQLVTVNVCRSKDKHRYTPRVRMKILISHPKIVEYNKFQV